MPRIVGVAKSGKSVGEIIKLGFTSLPFGHLACDGSSQLRATYPALFAAIGTTYGSVDGTHFTLPDLQGRSPMGDGAGSGLTARTIGQAVGTETHTLAGADLPPHAHVFDHGHGNTFGLSGTTSFATNDHGHNYSHTHQWGYLDGSGAYSLHSRSSSDTNSTVIDISFTPVEYSNTIARGTGAQFRYAEPNTGSGNLNLYTTGVVQNLNTGTGNAASTGGPSGSGTVGFGGGVSSFAGNTGNGPGTTAAITHSSPATVVRFAIAYQ